VPKSQVKANTRHLDMRKDHASSKQKILGCSSKPFLNLPLEESHKTTKELREKHKSFMNPIMSSKPLQKFVKHSSQSNQGSYQLDFSINLPLDECVDNIQAQRNGFSIKSLETRNEKSQSPKIRATALHN